MMQLVETKDLTRGRTGLIYRFFAGMAMRILGLRRLNRLYADTFADGGGSAAELLKRLDVQYIIGDKDRSNIPTTGAAVVVANHPTGLLDGILLIDLLGGVRGDVKFMGNFLLDRIEPFRKYFIAVDPFDSADTRRNLRGVREAVRHVQSGGMLVVFPAGEVAARHGGQVKDRPWPESIVRFIRSTGAPVIPVNIEARNSRLFRAAGTLHPALRTALLPRELLNKRGRRVNINVGSAIAPGKVSRLEPLEVYGDYLRANVEYLCGEPSRAKRSVQNAPKYAEPVAPPVDPATIETELEAIRSECLLFGHSDYDVYCAPTSRIPHTMREIGRLREVTFRAVGEGTGKASDTDDYDVYYHQLFIRDRVAGQIIGAYRLGMGGEIMPRFGLEGFYVNSLFRLLDPMAPIMERTIELGRSFIVEEYQRRPVSLMLLWKGILYMLLRHERYRYLLGPVTVSGEFSDSAKTVIVAHLDRHHFDRDVAQHVRPVVGLEGIDAPIDRSLIDRISDISLIDKLVRDIERDERSIPILVKKYLQLNSHVVGFNVDHDFADALDALMLLDLERIPESTLHLLSKELADTDVVARFRSAT